MQRGESGVVYRFHIASAVNNMMRIRSTPNTATMYLTMHLAPLCRLSPS